MEEDYNECIACSRKFEGDMIDFEDQGWVENEFGFVCPTCSGEFEE